MAQIAQLITSAKFQFQWKLTDRPSCKYIRTCIGCSGLYPQYRCPLSNNVFKATSLLYVWNIDVKLSTGQSTFTLSLAHGLSICRRILQRTLNMNFVRHLQKSKYCLSVNQQSQRLHINQYYILNVISLDVTTFVL